MAVSQKVALKFEVRLYQDFRGWGEEIVESLAQLKKNVWLTSCHIYDNSRKKKNFSRLWRDRFIAFCSGLVYLFNGISTHCELFNTDDILIGLFDLLMGSWEVLSLQVRVNLGVMTMKKSGTECSLCEGYSQHRTSHSDRTILFMSNLSLRCSCQNRRNKLLLNVDCLFTNSNVSL